MKTFAILATLSAAAIAQQVGSESGAKLSDGPSAVSNPNVNNGWQSQNSLFNSGSDGGNVFHDLHGNKFSSKLSNSAVNDNNFVNPSQSHVMGNKGDTTNGEGNHIGDVLDGVFHKRGGAIYGGYHQVWPVHHGYYRRGYHSYVAPVHVAPVHYMAPPPHYVAPVHVAPAHHGVYHAY